MRAIELAPRRLQRVEARQPFVVAQSARIVEVDVHESRHLGLRFEHLVDLLLVLDDRVGDRRVVQNERELRRRRILVHRHRHAAERLRGGHRPIEPRPVVADDREVHAAREAVRGEPARERPDLAGDLAPRPGLPDAQRFLAHRGTIAALLRVAQQQPWKRVGRSVHLPWSLSRSPCASGPCRPGRPVRAILAEPGHA
jgi:hypothetical protein